MSELLSPLEALNARIIACERCPRLRAYGIELARIKRRAYAGHDYWSKPVPSFGDEKARVLALGLAPGRMGPIAPGASSPATVPAIFFTRCCTRPALPRNPTPSAAMTA